MRKPAKLFTASAVAVLLGSLALAPQITMAGGHAKASSAAAAGKKVAENRKKGNCFACHAYEGIKLPGNIGPPLVAMKARFPDKARLKAQLVDPVQFNPDSMMPPYGKHNIISGKDIDNIVEWLYTL